MWLFTLACLLAVLKTLAHLEVVDVAGISAMSWWWVIGVVAATLLWWWWSDISGRTSRKAMDEMAQRKQARMDKQREQMGLRRKR